MMQDLILGWVLPPFSLIVVLLVLAFALARRGARWVISVCALVSLLLSMPAVANLLARPLEWAVTPYDPARVAAARTAVVVPTAGAFQLPDGRSWPEEGSVIRASHGHALARGLNLPLILTGGRTLEALSESEARATARALGLDESGLWLGEQARDTCENASEAREIAESQGIRQVIVVTDRLHMARAQACLRRHGLSPMAPPEPVAALLAPDWDGVVPGNRGLRASAGVLRRYLGIVWYIVTDRFDSVHLRPASASGSRNAGCGTACKIDPHLGVIGVQK